MPRSRLETLGPLQYRGQGGAAPAERVPFSRWYLSKYEDVAAAGVDPVDHYVRFGAIEGRSPGPLFDRRFYLMQLTQGLAKGADPLADFLSQPDRSKFLVNASQIDEKELRKSLDAMKSCALRRLPLGS